MTLEARLPAILFMLLAAALAGCLSDDDAPGADASRANDADDGSGDPVDGAEDANATVEPEPREVTLYLTADLGLSEVAPAAGHVVQGDFFADYYTGSADLSPFTFASDPLATAAVVEGAIAVTLWIESDAPVPPVPGTTETGGAAFVGSTLGMPYFGLRLNGGPFMHGAPTMYTFELPAHDLAPLVVPAGSSFALFGGLFAYTTDANPARILVGGDHASSITFTATNLSADPLAGLTASPVVETATGTIEKHGDPGPTHTFTIGENATEVRVEVVATGGRTADLDLDLLDASGTVRSASHTPSTYESMYLAGPALDGLRGTEVTILVGHFFTAQGTYEVTFTQR